MGKWRLEVVKNQHMSSARNFSPSFKKFPSTPMAKRCKCLGAQRSAVMLSGNWSSGWVILDCEIVKNPYHIIFFRLRRGVEKNRRGFRRGLNEKNDNVLGIRQKSTKQTWSCGIKQCHLHHPPVIMFKQVLCLPFPVMGWCMITNQPLLTILIIINHVSTIYQHYSQSLTVVDRYDRPLSLD